MTILICIIVSLCSQVIHLMKEEQLDSIGLIDTFADTAYLLAAVFGSIDVYDIPERNGDCLSQ